MVRISQVNVSDIVSGIQKAFRICYIPWAHFTDNKIDTQRFKGSKLKQHSEISGWLKHPFSVTPISRYSLNTLHSKFHLAMILRWWDMRDNMNYTSDCTEISDAHRHQKFENAQDLPILSNLYCTCRKPVEMGTFWIEVGTFWICNNIRMCGEKCALDQSISEYPFEEVS